MKLNKELVLLRLFLMLLFGLFPQIYHTAIAEVDWNECLEDLNAKWGTNCNNCMDSKDTYRVSYKNVCLEDIDVMICVQEKYLNWRCYTRFGLESQDTIFGYACKGSGRHLYWVKKAGNNQISFPTLEEVNEKYDD